MFRCLECQHLFEDGEQTTQREMIGEAWGVPAYEEKSVCPLCGGIYEEIKPCKICGGFENLESGETICEDCKKETVKLFQDLLNENFNEEQRIFLNDFYDGENF